MPNQYLMKNNLIVLNTLFGINSVRMFSIFIVCIGISPPPPSKTPPPLSCQAPPLNCQTVHAPFLGNLPFLLVFLEPPP